MSILILHTDWRSNAGLLGSRWLGIPLQMKKGIACDKEPKPESSEVQWSGELDRTFHWVLIRGTFQRVLAASQGLLQLSSQKGINIPAGLSGYCQCPRVDFRRESSPQRGYNWLWRELLSSWQNCKINCTHLARWRMLVDECWFMQDNVIIWRINDLARQLQSYREIS